MIPIIATSFHRANPYGILSFVFADPTITKEMHVLEAYRAHVAERAAEKIPPKPTMAGWVMFPRGRGSEA